MISGNAHVMTPADAQVAFNTLSNLQSGHSPGSAEDEPRQTQKGDVLSASTEANTQFNALPESPTELEPDDLFSNLSLQYEQIALIKAQKLHFSSKYTNYKEYFSIPLFILFHSWKSSILP